MSTAVFPSKKAAIPAAFSGLKSDDHLRHGAHHLIDLRGDAEQVAQQGIAVQEELAHGRIREQRLHDGGIQRRIHHGNHRGDQADDRVAANDAEHAAQQAVHAAQLRQAEHVIDEVDHEDQRRVGNRENDHKGNNVERGLPDGLRQALADGQRGERGAGGVAAERVDHGLGHGRVGQGLADAVERAGRAVAQDAAVLAELRDELAERVQTAERFLEAAVHEVVGQRAAQGRGNQPRGDEAERRQQGREEALLHAGDEADQENRQQDNVDDVHVFPSISLILRQRRTNEVVGRRMDLSSDANANFEGLLEVNRGICMPQMAEKTSPDVPPNCAVVP